MNRCSLFVDAAYLYATGGQLCFGTKRRIALARLGSGMSSGASGLNGTLHGRPLTI
jgi:hypothetical protein